MDTSRFDRYIEPPPRLYPIAEALPHVGGLALHQYTGELPEKIEPHPVEPLDDELTESAAREIMTRALAIPEVQARLGRGRVMQIGVARRGEPAKDEPRTYLFVGYDYDSNTALEIRLDEKVSLISMSDGYYQPPPTQREIGRAIELARRDERLAGKVSNLVGMALLFSGPNDEYADRRVLEVVFSLPAERAPRFRAWVDLGAEMVLHAGVIGECCPQTEGEQS